MLLLNRFLTHRQCAKCIAESQHRRAITLHACRVLMIGWRIGGSNSEIFPCGIPHWLHLIVLKVVHDVCVCTCDTADLGVFQQKLTCWQPWGKLDGSAGLYSWAVIIEALTLEFFSTFKYVLKATIAHLIPFILCISCCPEPQVPFSINLLLFFYWYTLNLNLCIRNYIYMLGHIQKTRCKKPFIYI